LWIAIGMMTILLLIFGEITPKTLAIQFPEKFSLLVVRPLRIFTVIVTPLQILLGMIADITSKIGGSTKNVSDPGSKTDFLSLVQEGERAGILTADERSTVNRILEMGEILVDKIMIPRTEMIALPEDITTQKAAETFLKHDLRRIPLYRGTVDHIIGILYAKDLLGEWLKSGIRRSPKSAARNPLFVPNCIGIKQVYSELKKNRLHLAIVLDEYGGTAGLITHEDILANLLGPVQHIPLNTNDVQPNEDGSFLINCRIPLLELKKITGIKLQSPRFITLNGYLIDRFGRIPQPGESLILKINKVNTWHVEIRQTSNARIEQVLIKPMKVGREVDK